MNYYIKISYDGSKFYGFQRQKDKKTVQEELEKSLTIINKGEVLVKGAGRTDALVHALGQGVSFRLDKDIPEDNLKKALNKLVGPYIQVEECRRVSNKFHARFSAIKKRYIYKIWIGDSSPFLNDYYLVYRNKLDLRRLKKCGRVFIGKHDFRNFVSGDRSNYNGTIYKVKFKKYKNEVDIIFEGKSFYRYMVRNLVGAMLSFNEGKCSLSDIKDMVDNKTSKRLPTAKASGLYLDKVYYKF